MRSSDIRENASSLIGAYMAKTLTQKIIDAHALEKNDREYALRIDQTLTQDCHRNHGPP